MERICPNCGKRQHAPDAIECSNCQTRLPGTTDSIVRSDQSVQDNRTSLARFSPCLIDTEEKVYRLNQEGDTLIGSHPNVNIQVKGTDVYSHHARIYFRGSAAFIVALSLGKLSVNRRPVINQERELAENDLIEIGHHKFLYKTRTQHSLRPEGDVDQQLIRRNDPTEHRVVTPQPQESSLLDCDFYGTGMLVEGPYSTQPLDTQGKKIKRALTYVVAIKFPAAIFFDRPEPPLAERNFRVQSPGGQQRLIIMRGDYASGTIQMGDEVSFWGKYESGTLFMTRAYNHTLQTWVQIR